MKSSHVREIICFALFIVLLGGPRSVYSTGQNQTTTDEGQNVTQPNGTTPEPSNSVTSTKLSTVMTEEPTHEVTDTKPFSALPLTTIDLHPTDVVENFLLMAKTKDITWNVSLSDVSQAYYKETEMLVKMELTNIYKKVPGFLFIEILRFEEGSVKVLFRIQLRKVGMKITKQSLEEQLKQKTEGNQLHFEVVTKEIKTLTKEGLKDWQIALIVVGILVCSGGAVSVLCKIGRRVSCNGNTYCCNCHCCHKNQGIDRFTVQYGDRRHTRHSATDGPAVLTDSCDRQLSFECRNQAFDVTADNVLAYSRHEQAIVDKGEQGVKKKKELALVTLNGKQRMVLQRWRTSYSARDRHINQKDAQLEC